MSLLIVILSYLVGSIPTSYLAGKWLKGIDLRQHGSGNVGATNVARVIGRKAAAAVLAIDILKGFLPVKAAEFWLGKDFIGPLAGFAAICGHNWSIFLRFAGGKGVATTAGVFTALAPLATAMAASVFFIVAGITKYVSAGSICSALALCLSCLLLKSPLPVAVFAGVACAFIIYRHWQNIERLLKGTENRWNQSRKE